MFNFLKDKLKNWVSGSKEKIQEQAEVVETEESVKEEPSPKEQTTEDITPKGQELSITKKDKIMDKADQLIEKTKKQKIPEPPQEFSIAKQKFEPDLEAIGEKADKLIEKAKQEHGEEPSKKFDLSKRDNIHDLEKAKQKAEKLEKEIKQAEKKQKDIKDFEEQLTKGLEEPALQPEKPAEPKTPKTFFQKLGSTLSYKISENEFNEIFDDLEMLLLENNVALEVVEDIRKNLAENLIGKEIKKQEIENEIKKELKNSLNKIIIEPDNPLEIIKLSQKPFIILFFGINGTGKTTSIAKIAHFLKKSNLKVVLAAADTFRAASIEQLNEHAKKLQIPLIKHDYGADPAAVGFDAIKYAKAHNIDVVLIDTAGRMHTKANLLEEMKKIERVTSPDLKIFVAESIAGNDAVEQAKTFNQAIEIDGAILSKADIDEKGGTIISISHATNKPIFYLGTGQNYDDLELFNKQKFIESLGL